MLSQDYIYSNIHIEQKLQNCGNQHGNKILRSANIMLVVRRKQFEKNSTFDSAYVFSYLRAAYINFKQYVKNPLPHGQKGTSNSETTRVKDLRLKPLLPQNYVVQRERSETISS